MFYFNGVTVLKMAILVLANMMYGNDEINGMMVM